MRLALVGLGKMGGNMARRLLRAGHQVVGFNRTYQVAQEIAAEAGLIPAQSLQETVQKLNPAQGDPSIVWSMLPAGKPTEQTVETLGECLSAGDIVIDGGNSNYKDSIRRAEYLQQKDIHFLDVGVSGGIWGLTQGYSMMIGGNREVVARLQTIFEALAPGPDTGWGHVGPNGAGHFAKMVHNGIEYGMMEAYAEGFELLHAHQSFGFDIHQMAEIWRHGSVVRSWLLDLAANALEKDSELSGVRDWVDDSGEGRWTVIEAIDQSVPAPAIAISLFRRFASRQDESYAAKLLAAMRHQFGGHDLKIDS